MSPNYLTTLKTKLFAGLIWSLRDGTAHLHVIIAAAYVYIGQIEALNVLKNYVAKSFLFLPAQCMKTQNCLSGYGLQQYI